MELNYDDDDYDNNNRRQPASQPARDDVDANKQIKAKAARLFICKPIQPLY